MGFCYFFGVKNTDTVKATPRAALGEFKSKANRGVIAVGKNAPIQRRRISAGSGNRGATFNPMIEKKVKPSNRLAKQNLWKWGAKSRGFALILSLCGFLGAATWGNAQDWPVVTYRLEHVRIEGNTKTSEAVIAAELMMKSGDQFDESLARVSRIRLLGLGLFERVDMRLEKGSVRGAVVWVIEVKERQTFVLERGFIGFNDEHRTYLGATFTQLNLFGSGQRGSLAGTLRDGKSKGMACSWTHPHLPSSAWLFSITGQLSESEDAFEEELEHYRVYHRRVELRLKVGRRQKEFLTFSGELKLRWIKILDRSKGAWSDYLNIVGDEDYQTAVAMEVEWDTRNNYYLPDRGVSLQIKAEFGEPFHGENHYMRGEFRAIGYLPFIGATYVSFQQHTGVCTGTTPYMLRFYRSEIVRGFGPSPFLGVTFQKETPRDTSLAFTSELHFPFMTRKTVKPIRAELFLFLDAGSAFDREDLEESALSLAVGTGLRVNTDFGVINLYLGFPIKD